MEKKPIFLIKAKNAKEFKYKYDTKCQSGIKYANNRVLTVFVTVLQRTKVC